jgi:hypothetical protein
LLFSKNSYCFTVIGHHVYNILQLKKDAELRTRLGHMSRVPCQVIFSMADEYIPEYVDKAKLLKRLCEAMGGAEKVAIPWGNHSLSNRVQETVHCIIDFIKREGPKGWDDPWG